MARSSYSERIGANVFRASSPEIRLERSRSLAAGQRDRPADRKLTSDPSGTPRSILL